MKVYGFHDHSGCGYYRIRLPFKQLADHGHDVGTHEGWNEAAREYPLIIGQRLDKSDALPQWRRLRATARLVYEIDDDVYSVDKVNWMAYRVYAKPIHQDAVTHAAQVANMVTVSTEPLAEVMRKATGHDNVVVLPNYVDDAIFDIQRPHRKNLVVGWAGGASHALDISMIAPSVKRYLKRNRTVELHLIGTDYRDTFNGKARFSPWSNDLFDYYRDIDFDIGLAPLYPTPFANSKSYIKALEYAALGIPVLASDLPPYRDFVLDGVTGFLIRQEHEWGRRLYELTCDADMRTEMGQKAREHAKAFTIQKNWWRWEQAYQSLL